MIQDSRADLLIFRSTELPAHLNCARNVLNNQTIILDLEAAENEPSTTHALILAGLIRLDSFTAHRHCRDLKSPNWA